MTVSTSKPHFKTYYTVVYEQPHVKTGVMVRRVTDYVEDKAWFRGHIERKGGRIYVSHWRIKMKKKFWQLFHHLVAHPLVGLSFGRLWAWKLHDWTLPKAWPGETRPPVSRWPGLE